MKTSHLLLVGAFISLTACNGGSTTDDTSTQDTGTEDTGTGDTGSAADDIAIMGTWDDNFGGSHTITNTTWDENGDGYTNAYAITQYDNEANFVVAQNSADNAFNGEKYSRFDWASDGSGGFYYCQSTFDAETEEAAAAATPADATDPATTGCGGSFAWTHLTAPQ